MTATNLDLLVQGDAFDIVKEIPDNYADCICIDPPYGISYYSGYYKGKNPHKKIIGDANLHFPLDELWRILKPTGAMFVFYSQKYQLSDPRIKNTIVWVKVNWTAGNLEGDFGKINSKLKANALVMFGNAQEYLPTSCSTQHRNHWL